MTNDPEPPYPTNGRARIIKAMEDDGLCLSGLNECNAPNDMRQWAQTPKGRAMFEWWKNTTTEEQRKQELEEYRAYSEKLQAWRARQT